MGDDCFEMALSFNEMGQEGARIGGRSFDGARKGDSRDRKEKGNDVWVSLTLPSETLRIRDEQRQPRSESTRGMCLA